MFFISKELPSTVVNPVGASLLEVPATTPKVQNPSTQHNVFLKMSSLASTGSSPVTGASLFIQELNGPALRIANAPVRTFQRLSELGF